MKRSKARACSLCQKPLKWWNTHSCTRCGQTICKRHSYTIRHTRSSVLFCFCTTCALHIVKRRVNSDNPSGVPRPRPTTNSPISSLSGFSLSGFSFSGFSFSGIKREPRQDNNQPDPTETDQNNDRSNPTETNQARQQDDSQEEEPHTDEG